MKQLFIAIFILKIFTGILQVQKSLINDQASLFERLSGTKGITELVVE